MICIVPVNQPMESAFYSVYSEAESLLLFSRYFPTCREDLVLFKIDDDSINLRSACPYKLVKHNQLKKIINRAFAGASE